MASYRGWRVYGPGPDGLWFAVRGRARVSAGSAMALRVAVDQQQTATGRVLDVGPV